MQKHYSALLQTPYLVDFHKHGTALPLPYLDYPPVVRGNVVGVSLRHTRIAFAKSLLGIWTFARLYYGSDAKDALKAL